MSKPTLVLIEDEFFLAEVVRDRFEGLGLSVEWFETAEEAYDFIVLNPNVVLILDLMLPGMGGIELIKKLRAIDRLKTLPIIVVSARGREEDRLNAYDTGANEYLAKPFDARILEELVMKYV